MSNITIMRYHHACIRMTEMKKTDNTSVGEDAQQLGFSHIVGGDVKWHKHFTNSLAVSEEVKQILTIGVG